MRHECFRRRHRHASLIRVKMTKSSQQQQQLTSRDAMIEVVGDAFTIFDSIDCRVELDDAVSNKRPVPFRCDCPSSSSSIPSVGQTDSPVSLDELCKQIKEKHENGEQKKNRT